MIDGIFLGVLLVMGLSLLLFVFFYWQEVIAYDTWIVFRKPANTLLLILFISFNCISILDYLRLECNIKENPQIPWFDAFGGISNAVYFGTFVQFLYLKTQKILEFESIWVHKILKYFVRSTQLYFMSWIFLLIVPFINQGQDEYCNTKRGLLIFNILVGAIILSLDMVFTFVFLRYVRISRRIINTSRDNSLMIVARYGLIHSFFLSPITAALYVVLVYSDGQLEKIMFLCYQISILLKLAAIVVMKYRLHVNSQISSAAESGSKTALGESVPDKVAKTGKVAKKSDTEFYSFPSSTGSESIG